MKFDGKTILFTGATGGMGSEIVKLLAKNDCKICLLYRSENKLRDLLKTLGENADKCIYKKCDISKENEIKESIDYMIKELGRIDLVILTTGILLSDKVKEFDIQNYKKSMDINFYSVLHFFDYLLPIFKSQKESFFAVFSTMADIRGTPLFGPYHSSKGALSNFIQSIRMEAKKNFNINVILIRPGTVKTAMIEDIDFNISINANKAAKYVLNGIKKEKSDIVFPLFERLIVKFIYFWPSWLSDKL